jgi:hypothetical protein
MRSRCASGCGGSDDLIVTVSPCSPLCQSGLCIRCPPIECQSPGEYHVPQRLQSVCVLLWRFPKLEVPFAVSQSVSKFGFRVRLGARRTHFGLGTVCKVSLAIDRCRMSFTEGSPWDAVVVSDVGVVDCEVQNSSWAKRLLRGRLAANQM